MVKKFLILFAVFLIILNISFVFASLDISTQKAVGDPDSDLNTMTMITTIGNIEVSYTYDYYRWNKAGSSWKFPCPEGMECNPTPLPKGKTIEINSLQHTLHLGTLAIPELAYWDSPYKIYVRRKQAKACFAEANANPLNRDTTARPVTDEYQIAFFQNENDPVSKKTGWREDSVGCTCDLSGSSPIYCSLGDDGWVEIIDYDTDTFPNPFYTAEDGFDVRMLIDSKFTGDTSNDNKVYAGITRGKGNPPYFPGAPLEFKFYWNRLDNSPVIDNLRICDQGTRCTPIWVDFVDCVANVHDPEGDLWTDSWRWESETGQLLGEGFRLDLREVPTNVEVVTCEYTATPASPSLVDPTVDQTSIPNPYYDGTPVDTGDTCKIYKKEDNAVEWIDVTNKGYWDVEPIVLGDTHDIKVNCYDELGNQIICPNDIYLFSSPTPPQFVEFGTFAFDPGFFDAFSTIKGTAISGGAEGSQHVSVESDELNFEGCAFFVDVIDETDTDGDGLPDWWEDQDGYYCVSSIVPYESGSDPDGDGRTNLDEYNEGTHPCVDEGDPVSCSLGFPGDVLNGIEIGESATGTARCYDGALATGNIVACPENGVWSYDNPPLSLEIELNTAIMLRGNAVGTGNVEVSYNSGAFSCDKDIVVGTIPQQNINSCMTIDEPGYYILTENLIAGVGLSCIVIDADDVTIDGAGNAIVGRLDVDDRGPAGIITINSPSNILIKNIKVVGFRSGIILVGVTDSSIEDSFTYLNGGSSGAGIVLVNQNPGQILRTLSFNNRDGIMIATRSDFITVEDSFACFNSFNDLWVDSEPVGATYLGTGNYFDNVIPVDDGWPILGSDYNICSSRPSCTDTDGDGVCNEWDCNPTVPNPKQELGDECIDILPGECPDHPTASEVCSGVTLDILDTNGQVCRTVTGTASCVPDVCPDGPNPGDVCDGQFIPLYDENGRICDVVIGTKDCTVPCPTGPAPEDVCDGTVVPIYNEDGDICDVVFGTKDCVPVCPDGPDPSTVCSGVIVPVVDGNGDICSVVVGTEDCVPVCPDGPDPATICEGNFEFVYDGDGNICKVVWGTRICEGGSHTECNAGTGICEEVAGPGISECFPIEGACTIPPESHADCVDGMCVLVVGAGSNGCTDSGQCTDPESHTECNAGTGICEEVAGPGAFECGPVGGSCTIPPLFYNVCTQDDRCVVTVGPGSDQCTVNANCEGDETYCGDGDVDSDGPDDIEDTADDEECDDGCLEGVPNVCEEVDNRDGSGCSATCKLEKYCGDGAIDRDNDDNFWEECDPGDIDDLDDDDMDDFTCLNIAGPEGPLEDTCLTCISSSCDANCEHEFQLEEEQTCDGVALESCELCEVISGVHTFHDGVTLTCADFGHEGCTRELAQCNADTCAPILEPCGACPAFCGDGLRTGDEECDFDPDTGDSIVGVHTCESLGYDSGQLGCEAGCLDFNYDDCRRIDGPELCSDVAIADCNMAIGGHYRSPPLNALTSDLIATIQAITPYRPDVLGLEILCGQKQSTDPTVAGDGIGDKCGVTFTCGCEWDVGVATCNNYRGIEYVENYIDSLGATKLCNPLPDNWLGVLGSCTTTVSTPVGSCEFPDDVYTISWTGEWDWDEAAIGYIPEGGLDIPPRGILCQDDSTTLECPDLTEIPFFTMFNLLVSLGLIVGIYFIFRRE